MSTQFRDVNRTVSPGDVVISVADIFDRLQGTVDENTLRQLLSDIISGRRNQVRPGELITADLINQILAQLESLESRVLALETGAPTGTMVITELRPPGPVAMQSELRILGRNFGVPSANVVTIGGVRASQIKSGSSDTELIVDVPLLAGVGEGGRTVPLTVSNASGFADTTVVVVPSVDPLPLGSLFINLSEAPTDPELLAGRNYVFVFSVRAFTNMEEVFTLTPSLSTGWAATIVNEAGGTVTPAEIRFPKSEPPVGTTLDVRVRVAIPSGAATGTAAQLRLAVASRRNPGGLNNTSGGDTITVGEEAPPPQRVTVAFDAVFGSPAATVADNVLVIPATAVTYRVDFSVSSEVAGNFNLALTSPGSLWTAQIQSGTSTGSLPAGQTRLVNLSLVAQPGAAPADLILRATKSDDPTIFGQVTQRIRLGP